MPEKLSWTKALEKIKLSDKLHEESIVVMTWTIACEPIFLNSKSLIVLVVDTGHPNRLRVYCVTIRE